MALNLILDASLPLLAEPGFWQFVSTRQMAESGNPADEASHQGIWWDEPTATLMLKPQQLDPAWLNTAAQVGSIIRLGQMAVNSADLSAQAIFEAPAFGNADNPYVFHVPSGPGAAFPGAARPEIPGSAPSLLGVPVPFNPAATDLLVQSPPIILQPSLTMPPTPPSITVIGGTANGAFVSQTPRQPANQGLFFRWFHPSSMLGFPCIYEFYVGQYKLRIKDVTVEVFRDISPHGDRSAWQKDQIAPLFSVGSLSPSATGSVLAVVRPEAQLAHDRYLLWLPYRHNQVLLYASTGKWAVLTVNGHPRRLADNSDWDITRSDTVVVWVQTPAPGRFQVQTLAYPAGTIQVQSPTITIDYTPSGGATATVSGDADHGAALTATQTQPPAYTPPVNSANDCPPATTTTTDLRRTFGIVLSLAASPDQQWTPFFYGYQFTAARVFETPATTPTTVIDQNSISSPVSTIKSATLRAGLEPGEGGGTVEVMDVGPAYTLAPYYYRCSVPVQLTDGGTPIYTGYSSHTEVTPLTVTGTPRRLTFSVTDRWKRLADTYLRDQRDWTGFGHIDVVKFLVEQGGVDCTSAEFPAGYTPVSDPELGILTPTNSPLGGTEKTVAQQTRELEPGWRPRDDDTAATFVKRIQDLYSAWYAGFRFDGTFFYLPREYFTTPTVTFTDHHSGGSAPFSRSPVTFTTDEPEANVILVKAASTVNGQVSYSSPWIDWASILNPAAVNYLGVWRAEVVTVGGTFTCAQLNWIARTIWFQTRRRYRRVSFEADFVPSLGIGHVCTLGSYGNYRITNIEIKIEHPVIRLATYHGYLVENGY